ncbi:MAG: thioredoxin domain-containing protein [Planctomycetia bacterium]|nr:thioredoxin domain-containing protein [Planctomycetia bacterium]
MQRMVEFFRGSIFWGLVIVGGLLGWGNITQGAEMFLCTDLDAAVRVSREMQRPMLVHFYFPTCGPCRRMADEVFRLSEVQDLAAQYYVTVLIDGEQHAGLANQFRVAFYPTDYIVTPEGKIVSRISGFQRSDVYMKFLQETAQRMQFTAMAPDEARRQAATILNPPSVPEPVPESVPESVTKPLPVAKPITPPAAEQIAEKAMKRTMKKVSKKTVKKTAKKAEEKTVESELPGLPEIEETPLPVEVSASGPEPVEEASLPGLSEESETVASPTEETPLETLPETVVPTEPTESVGMEESSKPNIMLDGYCPVTLVEQSCWKLGQAVYGVLHRGDLYFFVSREAMEKFYANPDFYAIVSNGKDVVAQVDAHVEVAGMRRYGVRYDQLNFVFASEENRKKFHENPEKYTEFARKEAASTAALTEIWRIR